MGLKLCFINIELPKYLNVRIAINKRKLRNYVYNVRKFAAYHVEYVKKYFMKYMK